MTSSAPDNRVELGLLGGFRVSLDGQPVAAQRWEHRRSADLVALLALAPGHRMVRDQVIEALWPELAPEAGLANLHKAAHHARRALQPTAEAVVLRSGVVALLPGGEVSCDAGRFEQAARRALALGDPAVCAAAADLYTGELLPDRRYDEWTVARREQLRHYHLELLRRAGRWHDVVAEEPTDEAAHRALMGEYRTRGDRHAAVRQFQRLRAVLAAELGVRPAPETVALHREIVADLSGVASGAVRPLVGREVALARLTAAAHAAPNRSAPPLLVTGEPGIGKTRLCEVFCDRARRAGLRVLQASAASASEPPGMPYGVVLAAARSADTELIDTLPEQVRALLAGGRPHSRQQVLAALAGLCAGAERGTVLLVDDAHLADDDSVALLQTLAAGTGSRCAMLLAFRPEQARPSLAALRADRSAVEVALPPLRRDESDELVTALCERPPDGPARDRVWQLAAGNPFFTTELATALSRGGTVEIPATLVTAVSPALSGLRDDLVERLRRVAVVDGTVGADEFVALSDLDEAAAFDVLDEALAAGVLVVDGEGYRFRHALVASSLVDGLAPHRRAAIHRCVAAALADTDGPPARVAMHLVAGGRAREAVPWQARAAREAAAVSAYADALGHVEAALAVEPGRGDLLALRADFRHARGDPTAAAAYGEAAAAATGPLRDVLRLRQGWALLMAGDVAGASAAMAGIVADGPTRLRLVLTTGLMAWFTGRIDEAERAAEQSRALALASGDTTDLLDTTLLAALVAHSRGRWGEQFRLDLFDPRFAGVLAGMLSDAHLCVAEIFLFGSDDLGAVVDFAARLRVTADQAGAARGAAFATTLLGKAELLRGDLDAAQRHLLDGARGHRTVRASGGESIALHALAEVALAARRPAAAEPLLDDALLAARLSPLSARHLLTRIYGTRIRAAGQDTATALAVMDEAQASLVRPAEACPLCWVPYLVPAATVLARSGQPDAATGMLSQAESLVGAMWGGRGRWAAAVAEARAEVARCQAPPAPAAQ